MSRASSASACPTEAIRSQPEASEAKTDTAWRRAGTIAGGIAAAAVLILLLPGLCEAALASARYGALAAILVAATYTDLRRRVVPNVLSALGTLVGLGFVAAAPGMAGTALGAAAMAGLALAMARGLGYLTSGQPGMGLGDVKLGAVLGLFLGWGVLWALYLAVAAAALFSIAGILSGRLARGRRIPFVPFMALGVGLHLTALPAHEVLAWLWL